MSRAAAAPARVLGVGEPIVVGRRKYRVRRIDRLGSGAYRIEAALPPARSARFLLRGIKPDLDRRAGVWRFANGGTVVELQRTPGRCRVCRCTDDRACEGGCSWVESDLCSACDEKDERAFLAEGAS